MVFSARPRVFFLFPMTCPAIVDRSVKGANLSYTYGVRKMGVEDETGIGINVRVVQYYFVLLAFRKFTCGVWRGGETSNYPSTLLSCSV